MAETTSFNLDTSGARREVEALRAEVQRLNQELLRAGQALATNPSPANGASFFQTAQNLSIAQGNLDNISGSAQPNYGAQSNAGAFARAAAPTTVQQQLGNAVAAAQFIQNSALPVNAQFAALNMMSGGSIPAFVQPNINRDAIASAYASSYARAIDPMGQISPAVLAMQGRINAAFASQSDRFALQDMDAAAAITSNYRARNIAMQSVMGYAAVSGISAGFDISTQNALRGGINPMATGGAAGEGFGTVLGGFLGSPGGVPGVALGALAGGRIFGSAGSWLMAPLQNSMDAKLGQLPLFNAARGENYGTIEQRNTRFSAIQESVNTQFDVNYATMFGRRVSTPGILSMTLPQVQQTYSSLSSGLIGGGVDPFERTSGRSDASLQAFRYATSALGIFSGNKRGSLADGYISQSISNIYGMASGREEVGEAYTRRLSRMFGKTAPEMAGKMAPMFAAVPETGGNIADMLGRFGAENTSTFLRLQNESWESPVSLRDLSASSASVRAAERGASIAAMQPRGSGFGASAQFQQAMNALSALPGGANSHAFAEASQRMRNARFEGFRQQDIMAFGIPMIHAQGELERSMMLPFAPGNVMGRQLDISRMANRQAGILERRLNTERGNLSEEQEAQMTQQIETLKTTAVRGIAMLSEGFENRLPALSAGRTAMFGRLNSFQMAAMAVRGTPMRGFGAADGGQLKEQDAFFSDVGRSFSSTSAVNAGGSVTNLLSRIATSLERMESKGGSGSTRPSEMNGQAAGALHGKRLGQETGGVN